MNMNLNPHKFYFKTMSKRLLSTRVKLKNSIKKKKINRIQNRMTSLRHNKLNLRK